MVECAKCGKTITNPDDLMVSIVENFLKPVCYCNECFIPILRKHSRYSTRGSPIPPLNSRGFRMLGIILGGIWFVALILAVLMTFEGELSFVEGGPYETYIALGLLTFLLLAWKRYYGIGQRKVKEVNSMRTY